MDSPSRYLVHQWILGQKVKGQGHRVTKCITSRRDSAAPSRYGWFFVLLKAIEWRRQLCTLSSAQPLVVWTDRHCTENDHPCWIKRSRKIRKQEYCPCNAARKHSTVVFNVQALSLRHLEMLVDMASLILPLKVKVLAKTKCNHVVQRCIHLYRHIFPYFTPSYGYSCENTTDSVQLVHRHTAHCTSENTTLK